MKRDAWQRCTRSSRHRDVRGHGHLSGKAEKAHRREFGWARADSANLDSEVQWRWRLHTLAGARTFPVHPSTHRPNLVGSREATQRNLYGVSRGPNANLEIAHPHERLLGQPTNVARDSRGN